MNSYRTFVSRLVLVLGIGLATLLAQDAREPAPPTAALSLLSVTEADLQIHISNGFRITDIEYRSGAGTSTRFDVQMVHNSGPLQINWWWTYSATASYVTSLINSNQARLIDLESYIDASGNRRFCGVMVDNTGVNGKAWWWVYDTSSATVDATAASNNARIIDIDSYELNGTTYYLGLMIGNTGTDQRAWNNYWNVSPTQLNFWMNAFGMRIYDIERRSNGNFDAVLIEQGNLPWHWWYDVTSTELGQLTGNYGVRIIDVERYTIGFSTRYVVSTLSNVNALTNDVSTAMRTTTDGDIGCWLQEIGGDNLASLNGDTPFEPAETIATLHHFHALREVHLGTVSLFTMIPTYTVYNLFEQTCPLNSALTAEWLTHVLRKMMQDGENTRIQAIVDYWGQAAVNNTASIWGLDQTSVNHRIGCTPAALADPNATTMRDLHTLHQVVANGWLGAERDTFYSLMLNDVNDLTVAAIVAAEAAQLGLSPATIQSFLSQTRLAHKGGGYRLVPAAVSPYHERSEFGYIKLPFVENGLVAMREYTFGAFVSAASNEADASNAVYTQALPLLLGDRIRDALSTWHNGIATVEDLGPGCGVPIFVQESVGLPQFGTVVEYQGSYGYGSAITAMALGLSDTQWNGLPLPLPFQALGAEPGCVVYSDVVTADVAISTPTGDSTFTFAVPGNASFLGFEYYTQLWTFIGANLKLSNGLRSTVGL